MPEDSVEHFNLDELNEKAISKPLVLHIHHTILMQEKHLTIWEVILPWKITMFYPWIKCMVKQQIMALHFM